MHKYIIALIVSLLFTYVLTWMTGFSANLMPALGVYEWTQTYINMYTFFANVYAHILPLAIISLITGFLLGKILKTRSIAIALIAAFFPICFIIYPYFYYPLNRFNLLHWFLEVPKPLVIIFFLIYGVNKFGIDLNMDSDR